jgi:DNA-binding transcriptional ArsR family regulator
MTGESKQAENLSPKLKHSLDRPMTPALLHALNHPIRRQILRLLSKPGSEMSPSEMSEQVNSPLPGLAYHARCLCAQKIIRCTKTVERTLSTQRFYRSNISGNDLVDTVLLETEKDDGPLVNSRPWQRMPKRSSFCLDALEEGAL